MFGKYKPALRQIATLLNDGQLEAAARLLSDSQLARHREARRLTRRLVDQLLQRAADHLARGALAQAWDDVALARQFVGNDQRAVELARSVAAALEAEVKRLLEAARPEAAVQLLEQFTRRGLDPNALRPAIETARHWQRARRYVRQGNLYGAVELLRALQPAPTAATTELRELQQRLERIQGLEAALAEALADERWQEVLTTAASILRELPSHGVALAARRRAWRALHGELDGFGPAEAVAPFPSAPHAPDGSASLAALEEQCQVLIDGGGSYLLCLGDQTTLGNRTGPADVRLLANVSSEHVAIRRDREGYVLLPRRSVLLNGRQLQRAAPLSDGAVVELVAGIRFRFRLPTPLSKTALLVPEQGSYLDTPYDAIVLMSRFCFLGDDDRCHLRAPETPRATLVVDSTRPLRFVLRATGRIQLNNTVVTDEAPITPPARVALPTVAIHFLPVSR